MQRFGIDKNEIPDLARVGWLYICCSRQMLIIMGALQYATGILDSCMF